MNSESGDSDVLRGATPAFAYIDPCSATLSERHRTNIFENKLLRIFGTERKKQEGGWRNLDNKKLHNLNPTANDIMFIKSMKMRRTGHVARTCEMINI
jgi:hypothetical protein